MRASTIFLLLVLGQAILFGQQNALLNRQVNVSFRNTSIEEILKSLETEDLSFVYSPEIFDVKKRVSITKQNTRLSVVLAELFAGQQMEMHEMKGQVLLRKKTVPKSVKNEELSDSTKQNQTTITQPVKAGQAATVEAEKPVNEKDSIGLGSLAETELAEETMANAKMKDSLDSFGAQSVDGGGQRLMHVSIFESRWPFKPYQPLEFRYEPANLNFSSIKPKYASPNTDQKSVWDEMAQANKKTQAAEKRQERAKPEKKFRMGIASYTGYTELNQEPSLLLGGKLIYYPSASFGVGLSGNAFMSQSFESEEAGANIRLEGGYGGLAFEYVLFPQSRIHLSFPITIGAGGFTYVDADQPIGVIGPRDSKAFFMMEGGIDLEINVTKFMKIGLGASYRDVSGSGLLNQNTQQEIINETALEGINYGITLKFGRF